MKHAQAEKTHTLERKTIVNENLDDDFFLQYIYKYINQIT